MRPLGKRFMPRDRVFSGLSVGNIIVLLGLPGFLSSALACAADRAVTIPAASPVPITSAVNQQRMEVPSQPPTVHTDDSRERALTAFSAYYEAEASLGRGGHLAYWIN